MNQELIRKILLKQKTKEQLFKQIFSRIQLTEEERKAALEIIRDSVSSKCEPTYNQVQIDMELASKLSSIIYQILKVNLVSFLLLADKYQKKRNNGSKPNKIYSSSKVKLRKLLELLVSKKILVKVSKGYLLDREFKEKLLSHLLA